MAWLTNWTYRKSHEINPQAGAGTNYQVKVIVHYGAGADSGEDVYLNGKCRTDFGDIRFTDGDEETELDYWMEYKVDSDYAIFWVEVTDDLSTDAQTIYIYYGKADATTTSNIFNTGLALSDDFNDASINAKWTPTIASGDTLEETGGNIHIACPHASWHNTRLRSTNSIATGDNLRFRLRWKSEQIGADTWKTYLMDAGITTFSWGVVFRAVIDNKLRLYTRIAGAIALRWTSTTIIANDTYYIIDILTTATQVKVILYNSTGTYIEDSGFQNCDEVTDFYVFPIWLGKGDASTADSYLDWCLHAKHVNPEPTHGAWGPEEVELIITTQAASEITISSAKLNASVTSTQTVVERGFDWGIISGVYTDDWTEEGSWTGTFSFNHTILSLSQGTTYYFRAKAKDSDGNWHYGDELSFTTLIRLTIEAHNLSGESLAVAITVNAAPHTTPYSEDFNKDAVVAVVITESDPVVQGGFTYEFRDWEDASTNKTRNVTMTGTSTITIVANYRKLFTLLITSDVVGRTISDVLGVEFNLSVGGG